MWLNDKEPSSKFCTHGKFISDILFETTIPKKILNSFRLRFGKLVAEGEIIQDVSANQRFLNILSRNSSIRVRNEYISVIFVPFSKI